MFLICFLYWAVVHYSASNPVNYSVVKVVEAVSMSFFSLAGRKIVIFLSSYEVIRTICIAREKRTKLLFLYVNLSRSSRCLSPPIKKVGINFHSIPFGLSRNRHFGCETRLDKRQNCQDSEWCLLRSARLMTNGTIMVKIYLTLIFRVISRSEGARHLENTRKYIVDARSVLFQIQSCGCVRRV